MKLLILGLNYAPEEVGIAVYTTGMAEAFAAGGHEVKVVSGRPYYPAWRIMEGHNAFTYAQERANGVDVIRVPHYIPAEPSGTRRLIHHASFAVLSALPMLWQALSFRPDVVMTVAPSLVAAPVARLAAALCGARSWLHVQDFEVEAAFVTGLLDERSRWARIAGLFESRVVASFDTVSTISPQMCRKLAAKGLAPERIVELRNWADIKAIRPLETPSPYRAEWGITTTHVALYAGNIANKQGIGIVVEAARRLAHRTDITFVVCGEGPSRGRLESQGAGLANIQFRDLQPRDRLNDLLGLATIHLLPQLAGAADLVLPSKLTNMLASGRPIIATTSPDTGLAHEVESCGLIVPPEDTKAFAEAITTLTDDAALWQKTAQSARRRAEERWDSKRIIARLVNHLEPRIGEPTYGEMVE